MKRKALVVALLCVMGLAAIFSGNAEAMTVYTCSLVYVGTNTATSYVYLTDLGGAFTSQVFLIDPALGNSKEMLAVFLTAWSNSQNVGVQVNGITALSTIYAVSAVK